MQNFESIVGVNFWTALFTLCNMLITFLILKKLLFKPVKKMIDDRQKEIADQYAEAERRRQEAEQAKLAYDQEIAQAKQKRDEIVREAAELAHRQERDILNAAREEAKAINAQGDIPVIFGLLTVLTHEQAEERAGGRLGNKGKEFALTAIKMVDYAWKLQK